MAGTGNLGENRIELYEHAYGPGQSMTMTTLPDFMPNITSPGSMP